MNPINPPSSSNQINEIINEINCLKLSSESDTPSTSKEMFQWPTQVTKKKETPVNLKIAKFIFQ